MIFVIDNNIIISSLKDLNEFQEHQWIYHNKYILIDTIDVENSKIYFITYEREFE